jgi:hypothetical protein
MSRGGRASRRPDDLPWTIRQRGAPTKNGIRSCSCTKGRRCPESPVFTGIHIDKTVISTRPTSLPRTAKHRQYPGQLSIAIARPATYHANSNASAARSHAPRACPHERSALWPCIAHRDFQARCRATRTQTVLCRTASVRRCIKMHRPYSADKRVAARKRPPNIETPRMAWPLHLERPWINGGPVSLQGFSNSP